MISVSLVLLTYNRFPSVLRSVDRNYDTAGYPIRELIHVDNGSDGNLVGITEELQPDIQIRHAKNLGVAKGYNRGMLLATSSHILITGCDRILPNSWLKAMADAYDKIPNTGVISLYSTNEFDSVRHNSEPYLENGVKIQRAIPFEARICSREFFLKAGFLREDLGLYGQEDCEWAYRAERVARENGLVNYVLPDLGLAEELDDHDGGKNYHDFKLKEAAEQWKLDLVKECRHHHNQYYNPYGGLR